MTELSDGEIGGEGRLLTLLLLQQNTMLLECFTICELQLQETQ